MTTTAHKTYRNSPHTDYQYAITGTHGATLYSIQHYQMLSTAAATEHCIIVPMAEGLELYTHCTRNATPNTWRTQ